MSSDSTKNYGSGKKEAVGSSQNEGASSSDEGSSSIGKSAKSNKNDSIVQIVPPMCRQLFVYSSQFSGALDVFFRLVSICLYRRLSPSLGQLLR